MGMGEREFPFLKSTHRLSHALGPREKQCLHRNLGQTLTAVLGGHPGKTGVNVASCEGGTLEAKLSGIFRSSAFLWRWPFWENLAPPVSQLLRSPRANNNPGGITAPPLSKQAA